MSLFGSIQLANNALFAAQVGLQVTGNNIANADTPGYIRQRVALKPAPTQQVGELRLGLGVEVDGIVQQADRFLAERLRGAISDVGSSETQQQAYVQLESLIGELSDADLGSAINEFFGSINDVLNQPEDPSLRNLATLQGSAVAEGIRRMDGRVHELRKDMNRQVVSAAEDINRLLQEVADLNVKVVTSEGGSASGSDGVGLRDQREVALAELAELVGIRAVEQPSGAVSVYAGGDFLVFEGEHQQVSPSFASGGGMSLATIHIDATESPLEASSGKLAGLYAARDEILGGFAGELDELAETLAFEFNRGYASGQGLTGYSELTGEFAVHDSESPLDQAGLPFSPVNGSFEVLVRNKRSGAVETEDVRVKLNGLDDDTSLTELTAALDAVEGIAAEVTSEGKLSIRGQSPEIEFGFADDTSDLLAALGMNVFFTGSSAGDLDVSSVVRGDPSKFAASRGGIAADADNAALLADFHNQPLESRDGASLSEQYEAMVVGVGQAASVTRSVTEGFRVFERSLEGQQLAVSGVSIDDEAVNMITFQRMYQASARYIATINELLDTLVQL